MELRFWDCPGVRNPAGISAAPSRDRCWLPLRKGVGKWREPLAEVAWEAETGRAGWGGCLGRKQASAPPAKVENPLVKSPCTH